jgi:hypothetical protein
MRPKNHQRVRYYLVAGIRGGCQILIINVVKHLENTLWIGG